MIAGVNRRLLDVGAAGRGVAMSREAASRILEELAGQIVGAPEEVKRIGRALGRELPARFVTVDLLVEDLKEREPRVSGKKARKAIEKGRDDNLAALVDHDELTEARQYDEEMRKARLRRKVASDLREEEAADRPMLADSVLEWGDLLVQPDPQWIVDTVLPERATVILYGASGIGKSFVAQSIAASVAGGFSWLGRDVQRGRVLYVFAEGGAGAGKRFRAQSDAWNKGKPLDDLRVLPLAPNLTFEGDITELETLNRVHDFGVIVWDTLNRVAGEAEENSATAMSGILDAMERIRRAGTRTTTVIVTHAGKNGDLRGSTALWAAADTVLELSGEATALKLDARKQKDAPEGLVGYFRLKPSTLHDTLIVEGVAPGQAQPSGMQSARVEEALAHFVRAFGVTGSTRVQFVDLLVEAGMAKKSTAQTYVGDLIAAGRIHAVAQGTRGTWLTLAPERTTFAL